MEKKYSGFDNAWFLLKNIIATDKILFLISVLTIPIGVIIPLLQAYVPKILIDSIQESKNISVFFKSILFILGILLLMKVLETLLDIIIDSRCAGQRVNFMGEFFKKNAKTDYQYVSSKAGLEHATKALDVVGGGDNAMIQQFSRYLSKLFISIIGIVFFGIYIIKLQPVLLIVILISAAINYLYGRYNVRVKERVVEETKEEDRKIEYLREKTGDLRFSKDMRLYRMNEWFFDTYKAIMKKWYPTASKERNADVLGEFINVIMIVLKDGLSYMFLIHNYINQSITISEFVFLLGIIKGFSDWVMGIVSQYNILKKELVPIAYYRSYVDRDDGLNCSAPFINPKDMTLELRDVCFRYQNSKEDIIKNLNLKIDSGEKIAIVGVNGAGKTTLVSLIMGLIKPTAGKILLGGKDINEYNIEEYYQLFSAVFQDVFLLPETIEDFLTGGEELKNEDRIDKILKEVGLYEAVNELPNKKKTYLMKSVRKNGVDLSGGQNQKLMLARALYMDGEITILDEPTAALDPIAESRIYEQYHEMTKNKTSIFISHRLSSTKFCDRIIFLENGEIVEEGSHKELMNKNGKYKEMFDIQAHYYKDEIGGDNGEIKAC